MSAITVQSTIPAELVAITAEALETRDNLMERAYAIIKDNSVQADNYAEAAETYKAMVAFARTVETQREAIKKPVLELGRAIDAAAREGCQDLEMLRQKLGILVNSWEAKERARVAEEQRAAREAALAAEEAERKRQEEALRAQAELAADPGEEPKQIDVAEIKVRPVPVAKVETFQGVTKATPKQKAQVTDLSKLPFMINGIRLWKEPDNRAIETLLKAGIAVPGAELVMDMRIGARG